MQIRYKRWLALRDVLVGLALSVLFALVFGAIFISEINWLGKVALGFVFGALLLAILMTLLKGLVRLTVGQIVLSFEETCLTYHHGLFSQHKLVIPYEEIAGITDQRTPFKEGLAQELGEDKVTKAGQLLETNLSKQGKGANLEDLENLKLTELVIQFKGEGKALQYARKLGIRLKSRLDYIERYNRLSLPLVDVSEFSIRDMLAYMAEQSIKS